MVGRWVTAELIAPAVSRAVSISVISAGLRRNSRAATMPETCFGLRTPTIAVDAMLQNLPGRISDEAERLFLSEAIVCFRNKAFRATIVMTWNLAYDHLLTWIVGNHLAAFNAAIPRK